MDYVGLVLRWLHILSAITLMGGTIFMRFGLHPALAAIPGETQAALKAAVRSQWAKWVMASSGFLLISGLVNTVITIKTFTYPGTSYHMLIGVKMLLALVIFFIASTLVGRSKNAEKFRESAVMWLNVNLVLAVIVVMIGGYLRLAPRVLKAETPEKPAARAPAEPNSTNYL